jgi:hypothetical protein
MEVVRSVSQIVRVLRRLEPVVVTAVHVPDRQRVELLGRNVVEAGDAHRNIVAADLLDVAVAEHRHAAGPAKAVVILLGVELVVAELAFARQQAEIRRLDHHAPVALLGTDRAIAPARASLEVDVRLEADPAAVAAAVIGLLHRRPFSRLSWNNVRRAKQLRSTIGRRHLLRRLDLPEGGLIHSCWRFSWDP